MMFEATNSVPRNNLRAVEIINVTLSGSILWVYLGGGSAVRVMRVAREHGAKLRRDSRHVRSLSCILARFGVFRAAAVPTCATGRFVNS